MKKTLLLQSLFTKLFLVFVVSMFFCTTASAIGISGVLTTVFDASWNQFNDNVGPSTTTSNTFIDDGTVGPGGGGQDFDAEYLFWKRSGNTLSLGLQAGFDLFDGHQVDSVGLDYWAGDLALRFTAPPGQNGNTQTVSGGGFTHAVDFGLETRDFTNVIASAGSYPGDLVGGTTGWSGATVTNAAGLYEIATLGDDITGWNNDVHGTYAADTTPFAMEDGTKLLDLLSNTTGYGQTYGDGTNTSYYRIVEFNVANFVDASGNLNLSAHWTMSCGNDAINGFVTIPGALVVIDPVPEPATIALLGIGLAGLGGGYFRRRIKRNKSKVQK